jgi:hypothetical protein
MKLYARTPCGIGLAIDILFTGQLKEKGGRLVEVEVLLPVGCAFVRGYSVEELPKASNGRQRLWVDPTDICGNNGDTVDRPALLAEIARGQENQP